MRKIRGLRMAAAPLAAGALLICAGTAAQAGTGGEQPPAGVVSSVAAPGTPELNPRGDGNEIIRQLVQCGGVMYAVGSFSQILQNGTTYARSNVFSFSATAPYAMTSFAPSVNGQVNSIAFNGTDCSSAYIGGTFTSVNGTKVNNLAEVTTATSALNTSFGHSASAEVDTLLGVNGHILAGGAFTTINGSSADKYFASLNPVTGKDDGYLQLGISGNYSYAPNNTTRVYNQALSHSGTLDLVMGDFTSVGGQQREQIFMLNLATSPATVTGWTSPQFDGSSNAYPYQCVGIEAFYIRAAAWSPDDSTVYIGDTGYHPNNGPADTGLCDAAAAFPATQTSVLSTWINYTGCDSLYAAAADAGAAYFAGHERYSMNPNACDSLGTGGYNAQGIEGLDPANGNLYVNAGATAGYYQRSRGKGADDMLDTSAGLWIASDNYTGAQMCGGRQSLSGICFLPYKKS